MDHSINGRLLNWYCLSSLCHTLRQYTRNKTHRNYRGSYRWECPLRVRHSANCFANSFLTNTLKPLYDFHFINRTDEAALPTSHTTGQGFEVISKCPDPRPILAGCSDLKTQVPWWGEGPQSTVHLKRPKALKCHAVEMGRWYSVQQESSADRTNHRETYRGSRNQTWNLNGTQIDGRERAE